MRWELRDAVVAGERVDRLSNIVITTPKISKSGFMRFLTVVTFWYFGKVYKPTTPATSEAAAE